LRLWRDSVVALFAKDMDQAPPVAAYTDKRRLWLANDRVDQSPTEIAAIFVLEEWSDTTDVWIGPISSQQACTALMRNAFQLDATDRPNSLRIVAQAVETARRVPLFAMDYPRQYDWLPRAADAIAARIAAVPVTVGAMDPSNP
jgi:hypothetical protein